MFLPIRRFFYMAVPLALGFGLIPLEFTLAQTKFKVGDQIEYKMGPQTYSGQVVEVRKNGWAKIEFEIDGHQTSRTVPLRQITLIKAKTDDEFRQWTDDTGEFSVRAKLIEQTDQAVKLKKEDGRVVTVPLDKVVRGEADIVLTASVVEAKPAAKSGHGRSPIRRHR